ncbi:alpha/beta hydrolase [Algibacter sp. L4_22]|uniref:alpha/beta hydrolase n=1 Tax=Algibacter sp. L4_22 TaxID=2942477 RepID=UPI00201B8950|nr:alpha/beta hydrolase [Algibacter sp. L4_22]MCL5130231.1 alpha/beta hydrolase [Algibacter sp. L4_22]
MKVFKFLSLNLLVLITFLGCSEKIEPIATTNILDTTQVYEEFDVVYGDDENQTFDLYLPANRTLDTKVIILVHGGGWSGGDKTEMDALKTLLIEDFPDVAIANINYRLADSNNKPYPMQTNDISTVVRYLKTNEIKLSISDQLGFIGTSAGGHLSLLWAYSFDTLQKTNMVCSIVGPTNLTDPNYVTAAEESDELATYLNLFGDNLTDEYLQEASPLYQVTANAPATQLFYGGNDPLIPISQGADLNEKLSKLNVTHEYTLYPEAGHGWTGLEFLDTWTKMKAFINTNL